MAVSSFWYLVRTLLSSENDWPEVQRKLRREKGKWGRLEKILGWKEADRRTAGRFYVAVVQAVLLFGSKTWVLTPRLEKAIEVFHQRETHQMAGMEPQTSTGCYMVVLTYWGGADNGGTGGYWGIYRPPSEYGCTIYYDLS